MKKKILVTGGAGYIGAPLVGELLKKDYKVKVIDNLLFGDEALKPYSKKIEFIKADIRTVKSDVLEDIYGVIHQAGLSNDPMADFDPEANHKINTEATIRLAKMCKKMGVKRFTFASSASIYNQSLKGSMKVKSEESHVEPNAAYSVSKLKAEQGLIKLADKNFWPIIFRQGTVYGFSPRMRYDLVVNTMLKTSLAEGKIYVFCGGIQWRPLVDVKDVCIAHIKALELSAQFKGEIINLSYDNYRIIDLARIVKNEVKKTLRKNVEIIIDYSERKDRSYKISTRKITKILKWHPKVSLVNSIKNMIIEIERHRYNDFDNPIYYNIVTFKEVNKSRKG